MKTSKFLMIITVVAIGLMSLSFNSKEEAPPKSKTVVKITLLEALQNPGLVSSMYEQLNDDFLDDKSDKNYYQMVYHNNITWVISGTYAQWTQFFRLRVKFASFDLDTD